ncbi:hypothetical protein [Poseidonocella sedimentorum]|uniref:Sulfotransferase family protein n=1 Tax=Poseidonocella sedimentorum TaxID=871652 RepID=A0A1I6DVN4_9RHOB|nr:hypothetical protein [Poseidonocella sedimentorum]SFR09496.1 hypothetical protein SAMN04515673_105245 [Poseidonocella sedimentorum]
MARELPFAERNLRRARVYSGRLIRAASPAARVPRVIFFHMPKCGGTSLSEALYATVPLSERIGVLDARSTRRAAAMMAACRDDPWLCHEDLGRGAEVFALREALALQHIAWDSALIHGHLLCSDRLEAFAHQRYGFVTLLRDPVERMVSNYLMARRAGIAPEDPDAYLDSPLARHHAQVYLRYFSGLAEPGEVPQAPRLAAERLARFDLIGFLDDLDGFAAAYRARFGPALRIHSYNRAPSGDSPFSASQMARASELCAEDVALFEAARAVAEAIAPAREAG